MDPLALAALYIDPDKGVNNADEALAGARDIIAEMVAEDHAARERMRELFNSKGLLRSKVLKGKEDEGAKYRDYFDWEEPVSSAPSHRVLAMRRGENESFLALQIAPPEEEAVSILEGLFVKGSGADSEQVRLAVHDSYKRLLSLSMETETRLAGKEKGGGGGDSGLCREPAPAPSVPASRAEERPGDRPGLPHGLQGSMSRQAGPASASRRYLPDNVREGKGRIRGEGPRALRKIQYRGR